MIRCKVAVVFIAIVLAWAVAAPAEQPAGPTAAAASQAGVEKAPAAKPAPNTASEVTLQTLPATTLLALPMRGSFDQHGAAIGKVIQYAMKTGVMRGAPLGLYYDDPEKVPADSVRWEVCVPVAPEAKVEEPFVICTLPEMQAAVVTCTGPYEGTTPCYGVLTAWLAQNGYVISGPVQEHWLSDPSMSPEEMQSKIVFPVKKAPAPQP